MLALIADSWRMGASTIVIPMINETKSPVVMTPRIDSEVANATIAAKAIDTINWMSGTLIAFATDSFKCSLRLL